MKTVILLQCIIIASLLLAIFAGIPMALSSSSALTSSKSSLPARSQLTASSSLNVHGASARGEILNKPVSAAGITPLGATGSGWKPDTHVSDIAEVNNSKYMPSISSYVNPATNASTLYVASLWFQPTRSAPDYELMVYASNDNGNTWWGWFHFWWTGAAGVRAASITAVAYNDTVFIATENALSSGSGNHWIGIIKLDGGWWYYDVATDADYRNPQLTSDYGYTTNTFLYITYEKYTNYDYREVYAATSTDWGVTWVYKQTVFGGFTWCYTQASIFYAQGYVYIAVRDSATYYATGFISVARSGPYDWGANWAFAYDVNYPALADASLPSIAAAHIGSGGPATVIVAYEYNASASNHDILFTWSLDWGATWTGGADSYHQIATSSGYEFYTKVTVDGMGSQSTNVGGNFHLVYEKHAYGTYYDLYYTQLPYWDIPVYYGGPYAYAGYHLGWSTPQGLVTDGLGDVYLIPTITTYMRQVGSQFLWEPGVAWEDLRNWIVSPYKTNIYYSTPGTDFSITLNPSSQSVVAGNSIGYYVTVNLLSGPSVTAYMGGTVNWPSGWLWPYASMSYDVSTLSPTGTCTCTLSTNNFMSAGIYSFTVTATIGGYRRIVYVPYTVTAPKTLTLNISPTTAKRGVTVVTYSGQLAPVTISQKVHILIRSHATGTWTQLLTVTTTTAGLYKVTHTFLATKAPGLYDIEAFWVNSNTGQYATSPINVITVTT